MLIGFDPQSINWIFSSTKIKNPKLDREKFRNKFPEYFQENFTWDGLGDYWSQFYGRTPLEMLLECYSLEDLVRIWFADDSDYYLGKSFESKDEYRLLERLRQSYWEYGHRYRDDDRYQNLVRDLVGLKKLSWPGFDLRLTWIGTYGAQGYSVHVDDSIPIRARLGFEKSKEESLYIDACFAILVYYQNKHVLTIGTGFSKYGVLINQVQLRKKTGNRFLFKLESHYLDEVLEVLFKAFGDCLWLVEGKNAAEVVRASYGDKPCNMSEEDEERIAKFYNRELKNFVRDQELKKIERRKYFRLRRKQGE